MIRWHILLCSILRFEYLHFKDDVTIEKSAKYRDCLSETLTSFEARYCSNKLGFTCGFSNGNFYIRSFLLEQLSQYSYFFSYVKNISIYEIISMKPNVWQRKKLFCTQNCTTAWHNDFSINVRELARSGQMYSICLNLGLLWFYRVLF